MEKKLNAYLVERTFTDAQNNQRSYVACVVELDGRQFEVAPPKNTDDSVLFKYLKKKFFGGN